MMRGDFTDGHYQALGPVAKGRLLVDETMLKEGAAKLQALHEAQAPATPVIPLTTAITTKRVGPSTGRVSRA